MSIATIENFTLDTYTNAEHVSSLLNKTGIVIVHDFLHSGTVEILKDEGIRLLDHQAEWVTKLPYSVGKYVQAIRAQLDSEQFPVIAQTFAAPFMQELTDVYLGAANICNYDIYIAKDIPGTTHDNQVWHFDRYPHLKFFLYLTDVTEKSGPLVCIPGTQKFVKELQKERREKGIWLNIQEVGQITIQGLEPEIPIVGKAGTLIIFDSDTLHKASFIEEGMRLVLRSRCLPSYAHMFL